MDVVGIVVGVIVGAVASFFYFKNVGEKSKKRILEALRDKFAEGIERNVPAPVDEPVHTYLHRSITRNLEEAFKDQGLAVAASGVTEPHPSWQPKEPSEVVADMRYAAKNFSAA